MLIRISLIVAILSGLAVGGLNFIKVKEKITTLQADLKRETDAKVKALADLSKANNDLKATTAKLKQTEATLASTTEELTKAQKEVETQAKLAAKLNEELGKTRTERDTAQAELAAYVATGYKPPQILAFDKQIKGLQRSVDGLQEENKILDQKIVRLDNELALYKDPNYVVSLPASLKGKVLDVDPKWNFVVLDVGQDQGILPHGELLVNRNGKLVAKVVVRSVQKDRCIANIMPGWQLGEIIEGDLVIPAHPAS